MFCVVSSLLFYCPTFFVTFSFLPCYFIVPPVLLPFRFFLVISLSHLFVTFSTELFSHTFNVNSVLVKIYVSWHIVPVYIGVVVRVIHPHLCVQLGVKSYELWVNTWLFVGHSKPSKFNFLLVTNVFLCMFIKCVLNKLFEIDLTWEPNV